MRYWLLLAVALPMFAGCNLQLGPSARENLVPLGHFERGVTALRSPGGLHPDPLNDQSRSLLLGLIEAEEEIAIDVLHVVPYRADSAGVEANPARSATFELQGLRSGRTFTLEQADRGNQWLTSFFLIDNEFVLFPHLFADLDAQVAQLAIPEPEREQRIQQATMFRIYLVSASEAAAEEIRLLLAMPAEAGGSHTEVRLVARLSDMTDESSQETETVEVLVPWTAVPVYRLWDVPDASTDNRSDD